MLIASPRSKRAFSLVELSIVLVILGLLIGGILTGQSLIRAAELRAVTTDVSKTITMMHTFRDKYFAMPGDMTNAVKFWGAQAGGTADGMDATCWALAVAASSKATCNGNGNGRIETYSPETFRAWQHLANAGLVEGTYAGIAAPGGSTGYMRPGYNVYQTRVAQVGIGIAYWGNSVGHAADFDGAYGNALIIGKDKTDWESSGLFLKPEEAWNMDVKIDDGLPGRGKLFAHPWDWGTCTTAANSNDPNATYAFGSTAIACSAKYRDAI
jgi:prepilin-type N-terminal cleavage/methylation domain-containing protein